MRSMKCEKGPCMQRFEAVGVYRNTHPIHLTYRMTAAHG